MTGILNSKLKYHNDALDPFTCITLRQMFARYCACKNWPTLDVPIESSLMDIKSEAFLCQ